MSSISKPHHEACNTMSLNLEQLWKEEIDGQNDGKIRVCTLTPKYLNIVWGNDERYWKIPKDDKGKEIEGPAELVQVSWLEVTGVVPLPEVTVGKKYKVRFQVSLVAKEATSWRSTPVFMMAKVGKKGKYSWKRIKSLNLKSGGDGEVPFLIPDKDEGELVVTVTSGSADDHNQLYFGLYEVWSGKLKKGLKIHHACISEC